MKALRHWILMRREYELSIVSAANRVFVIRWPWRWYFDHLYATGQWAKLFRLGLGE